MIKSGRLEIGLELVAPDVVWNPEVTEAPGGLGAGAIVYHFAACDEEDSAVLYHSPAALARAQLEVSV